MAIGRNLVQLTGLLMDYRNSDLIVIESRHFICCCDFRVTPHILKGLIQGVVDERCIVVSCLLLIQNIIAIGRNMVQLNGLVIDYTNHMIDLQIVIELRHFICCCDFRSITPHILEGLIHGVVDE